MKKKLQLTILGIVGFLTINAQDSLNMKKLSVWTSPSAVEYNDCWGYTDNAGREYAILGSDWGTHFLEVTDPTNPIEVNSFIGYNNNVTWRDFKIVGQYAYGVADNYYNSLEIYDLSNLPNSVSLVSSYTYNSESAHNIFIEGDRAYLCSNRRNDTIHALDILSLEDPENPYLLITMDDSYFGGCPWGSLHDIYVKNNIAYCSAGNCGMYIYDLNDIENPILLGSITSYSAQGYNHSSWAHEDGNILVMADEVPNSLPLKSHDISNVSNPVELTTFESTVGARPHNPFFVKNDLVVSYYMDGLHIFDFTDPSNPVRTAFYDTYPWNDTLANPFPDEWYGAWGTYPFFKSRNIVVSDITGGMFMVTKEKDIYITNEKTSICDDPDSIITIDFHVKGDFNGGNNFYLELADANGSFLTGQKIDTIAANLEGDYTFTFNPNGYTATKFRFRISSTSPVMNESTWLDLDYSVTPSVPVITNNAGVLSVTDNAETYQWYWNGVPVLGATNATYTPQGIGVAYVEAFNGGCKSTSQEISLSINKIEKTSEFLVYPNPSNGLVQIYNAKKDKLKIIVFDSKGAELQQLYSTDRIVVLDLKSGINFVKIQSENSIQTEKVVVF